MYIYVYMYICIYAYIHTHTYRLAAQHERHNEHTFSNVLACMLVMRPFRDVHVLGLHVRLRCAFTSDDLCCSQAQT